MTALPTMATGITTPRSPGFEEFTVVRGGPVIMDRRHCPLGQRLPYPRAGGGHPAPTGWADMIAARGWQVTLPDTSLGDTLLGLATVAALHTVTADREIHYRGPRAGLLRRSTLPITTTSASGPHVLSVAGRTGVRPVQVPVVPEGPPTWLDVLDERQVQVHAAMPMRYYLDLEQRLGVRLPREAAPAPGWRARGAARAGQVVFVAATSRPDRKDYGLTGFSAVADALTARRPGLSFAVLTRRDTEPTRPTGDHVTGGAVDMLGAVDAVDALEVFAGAELVIGNDTGLTHLAALTERPDGTSPHVLGLYARHAHSKWTTGRATHHAVATPFSALLSAADRCPVRDRLDDTLWGPAAAITVLPAAGIADAAGRCAGWW